ncbi:hypothetical protein GmHk_07G019949 [Glycine max]|nr:hypothetical protein GmHk_07G019949 [Glycine max]
MILHTWLKAVVPCDGRTAPSLVFPTFSSNKRLWRLHAFSSHVRRTREPHVALLPKGRLRHRVKHFIFPADFVVMDISEDTDIPVILGRPFMLTASCIVDMGKRKLELGFEDQKIDFDLFVEDKPAPEHNVCLQRKSIGMRPTSQYDTRRFSSLDAWTRYTDNVLGRKILPERKVELYHTKLDDFKAELERRNFHKHLTNLADGSIDLALVKEFYAHLYTSEDRPPKQSRVRGHLVKIDADSLNAFLETPMVLAEGETLPTYSRYCRLPTDFREIEAALCIPGRGFILNFEGHPRRILRKDLTALAQVWSVLSYSNLAPTSHTYDLTADRARLILGLVSHLDMNIGALISGQMTSIAQSNTSKLGFPALITALCRARGVVSDSLTFERLSPIINLAYIRKNCWNLEDLTVSIRGARRARARPAELPSTSAAPTPAAPSVPAQTNF